MKVQGKAGRQKKKRRQQGRYDAVYDASELMIAREGEKRVENIPDRRSKQ